MSEPDHHVSSPLGARVITRNALRKGQSQSAKLHAIHEQQPSQPTERTMPPTKPDWAVGLSSQVVDAINEAIVEYGGNSLRYRRQGVDLLSFVEGAVIDAVPMGDRVPKLPSDLCAALQAVQQNHGPIADPNKPLAILTQ